MMTNPIRALQKPATIQGSVRANRISATISKNPSPPGASASAARTNDPVIASKNRTANAARLANMIFPTASVSFIFGTGTAGGTGYDFSLEIGWGGFFYKQKGPTEIHTRS